MMWLELLADLCSGDTGPGAPLLGFSKLVIFAAYLLICVAFWQARRLASDDDAKLALFQLIGIFVLCGLSGYLLPALHAPLWAQFLSHSGLIGFAVWFLVASRHKAIMRAMTGGHKG